MQSNTKLLLLSVEDEGSYGDCDCRPVVTEITTPEQLAHVVSNMLIYGDVDPFLNTLNNGRIDLVGYLRDSLLKGVVEESLHVYIPGANYGSSSTIEPLVPSNKRRYDQLLERVAAGTAHLVHYAKVDKDANPEVYRDLQNAKKREAARKAKEQAKKDAAAAKKKQKAIEKAKKLLANAEK